MATHMPMTAKQLGPVIADLVRQHRAEKTRLDRIALYVRGVANDIYVPREATSEYRMLVDQSRFNVMPLVVGAVAQNLYVDGYRPTGPNGRAPDRDNAPIWDEVWQANRMDARQASIWRAAIKYGWSYATVLPGNPVPVITPHSPRRLTAIYDDPINDEWPRYAMVCHPGGIGATEAATGSDPLSVPQVDAGTKLTVYDAEHRYHIVKTQGGWALRGGPEEHGLGVCPVVRFLDEQGNDDDDVVVSQGKVEPLLPAQRQLNQISYGLAMALQYAAFRQRWATGMTIEEDAQGNPVKPWNSAVNKVWQNESPDGKFGDFAQTDVKGYLEARDKVLLYVSSMGQIPPHNLLVGAGISNISAEALAALESGHRHDIAEHQTSFGESSEQLLRLAGKAKGDNEAWEDMSAQVVWRDTTPRSLSQVADALGKLATQLNIPVQALWERIPGVTDQDISRWTAMADEQQVMDDLAAMLAADQPQEGPGAVADRDPADALAPA